MSNFSLHSESDSHGYFEVHTEAYSLSGESIGPKIYDSDGFCFQGDYFYTDFNKVVYTVLDDNKIKEEQYTNNGNVVISTYLPCSKDGASFNK